ncbi:hypothetical protein EDB89DRAFT_1909524 [Lactarius sanguifluus]|nr:hypothetical protein EDB89DRAFT_1909524 [Lactarius sanguifluus]
MAIHFPLLRTFPGSPLTFHALQSHCQRFGVPRQHALQKWSSFVKCGTRQGHSSAGRSVTTASSRADAPVRLRTQKDANARLQRRCHMRADVCGELEDRRRAKRHYQEPRAGTKRSFRQVQVHQQQWQHHADNGSLCRRQIGPSYQQQVMWTIPCILREDYSFRDSVRDGCDSLQVEMSTSYTREYEYSSEFSEERLVLDSYSLARVLVSASTRQLSPVETRTRGNHHCRLLRHGRGRSGLLSATVVVVFASLSLWPTVVVVVVDAASGRVVSSVAGLARVPPGGEFVAATVVVVRKYAIVHDRGTTLSSPSSSWSTVGGGSNPMTARWRQHLGRRDSDDDDGPGDPPIPTDHDNGRHSKGVTPTEDDNSKTTPIDDDDKDDYAARQRAIPTTAHWHTTTQTASCSLLLLYYHEDSNQSHAPHRRIAATTKAKTVTTMAPVDNVSQQQATAGMAAARQQ